MKSSDVALILVALLLIGGLVEWLSGAPLGL